MKLNLSNTLFLSWSIVDVILFIWFWLCWVFIAVRLFPSCSEWGSSLVAVSRLLIAVACLVAKHRL